MKKIITLFSLVLACVMAGTPSWAALLESPAKEGLVSGVGFISGWKCDASNITVTIDGGEHLSVAMGQSRGDLRPVCGSINHGFIVQINWGYVGDGEHEAVAYDNGLEFSRSTFTVGSTGEEFLKGAKTTRLLSNFLSRGETTVLEWNESTQHFEIREVLEDAELGGYDLSYWRQYNEDDYNFDLGVRPYWEADFLYAAAPDIDACRAGRLTQAAKDRALEAMNQIRALHGLEPVQYSLRYDQQVQAAALIQGANRFLNHRPPPSALCYTEAGAVGSRASNLHRGGGDNRDWHADSVRCMVSWTNDARNADLVTAVGHRRWMLNPFAAYMSYGQVYGYAAQKVSGFDEEPAITPHVAVDFVAFPFEVYPFNLIGEGTPWSFSLIENKSDLRGNEHPYFDNATITVRRVSDGAGLIIRDRYSDTIGYGVPNVLSWQVEGWEHDTLYEVEISHVAMRSGAMQSYSYPVLIDRANIEY